MNKEMRKIYQDLLLRLSKGLISPGELLPKETELADQFATNRMNAHRAVKILEDHGLVSRKKRIGTRVNPDLDHEKLQRLLNESNRSIHVLYSMTPHLIHWNEASFAGLEKTVETAGFSVNYSNIPTGQSRSSYQTLLKKISDAGASALVIFPDSEDTLFLAQNADLLANFEMPIFMLNRGGEQMNMNMVSFVSMDPLGDGVLAGELLRKNKCADIIMLNEATGACFWGTARFKGLEMEINRFETPKIKLRNIPGTLENIATLPGIIAGSSDKVTVVAVNNQYAALLADQCEARGLRYPDNYNLISFDDNPLYRSYNISSFGVPLREIGELFGRLICDDSWLSRYRGKITVKVSSVLNIRASFVPETH